MEMLTLLMRIIDNLAREWKKVMLVGTIFTGFSNFIYSLFSSYVVDLFGNFFRGFGSTVVIVTVFLFAFLWFLKAKPQKKPSEYEIDIFDVYGNKTAIDDLRTVFSNHDVAWSFMKDYKKKYPLHNFALVASNPNSSRKTIFRYI